MTPRPPPKRMNGRACSLSPRPLRPNLSTPQRPTKQEERNSYSSVVSDAIRTGTRSQVGSPSCSSPPGRRHLTPHVFPAAKINMFLRERVIGRNKKKKNGTRDLETIGLSTIRQYLSAVISLFKEQQTMNMNSNPPPGEDLAVISLMRTAARNENARKRAEYVDRGVGTPRDGYLDFQALSQYFYSQNTELSLRNRWVLCFLGLLHPLTFRVNM